jgi:hypothetical protein
MAKPTIVTRATKGSALTWTEGDSNFSNLQNATLTVKAGTGGTDVVSDLNGTVTLVAGTNVTLTGDNTAKTVTINASGGGGDVVSDTTPQLGGDLDVQDNIITTSTVDGNISLAPNGDGRVVIDGVNATDGIGVLQVGDIVNTGTDALVLSSSAEIALESNSVIIGNLNTNTRITTQGTSDLVLNTNEGTSTGSITIADGANQNITIAPNPASSEININFNNITDLNGGTLKIINSLGQQVATTPITTSGTNSTMQLATWGGTGMYFVQIINPQGQIVDIKKIILQ